MAKLFTLTLLTIFLSACATANRHIWEIPDPSAKHLVLFRAHPKFGDSVVYNSDYCQQIGKACEFFLSHAYAHDVFNDIPLPPTHYSKNMEDRADCWAARYAEPEAVFAAVELMTNNPKKVPITGDTSLRAENIRNCAKQYGNWLGA